MEALRTCKGYGPPCPYNSVAYTLEDLEKFHGDAKSRYGKTNICKWCHSNRYISNRRENWKKLWEYKGSMCKGCGENEDIPALYDLHHRNPEEKEVGISRILGLFDNWEAIKTEADKCDLLCATCHRREHHRLSKEKFNERN